MSTMEERQRESDRQRGEYDVRQMDKARFGDLFSFAGDMTRTHAAVLMDDRKFLPPPIAENDPSRLAAIQDEVTTEGRVHRNTRPQRHE